MSDLTLTKTSFEGGVWAGVLTGVPSGQQPPVLRILLRGKEVAKAMVSHDEQNFTHNVRIELPVEVLADGVQSLLILPEGEVAPLASIRLVSGAPLDQDLQAEIEELRAELDLLKSAFRRHCAEGM